jgi:short-subunit dehydrogenase
MKARGDGQIVNVSSELGRVPLVVPRTAYSGAKHFMNALTEGFRSELASAHPGITITTVSPGLTYTEFHTSALHSGRGGHRLPGGQGPEQVASVVLHAIETRALDMYTREDAKGRMLEYLDRLTSNPPQAA